MLNLLTEPLIRCDQSSGGCVDVTLPQVYAALMADEVEAFPALRSHQRHAWHAFLVQLSAMAVHRKGLEDPPKTTEEWAGLLRGLTSDWPDDEPWQLVVDDIIKPAFMQPPARTREREQDYKTMVTTPDDLDMLVTSKNHDLKAKVAEQAHTDDWIFALVTLQTMEGYGGRYNYGISRMPSGYGNRPAFSLTPSTRPGGHFKHDLIALMKHKQAILDDYPMTDPGITLLWVMPWDGTKAEPKLLTEMAPYYIEICRRIRLKRESDKVVAARANSDERRIVDAKGLTGDPWSPVSNNANPRGTPPAFLGARKFGYQRVVDGLFSADWKQPLLLTPAASGRGTDGDMQLVARGMVRGEGGTEGYHERNIPLRHRTLQIFGRTGGAKQLEDIARERIEDVGTVQRILSHAIQVFAARGDADNITPEQRSLARTWLTRLDEMVDTTFFDELQMEFEADDSARQGIRRNWLMNDESEDGVINHARALLSYAEDSLPCSSMYRYKARTNAETLFRIRIEREVMARFAPLGDEE